MNAAVKLEAPPRWLGNYEGQSMFQMSDGGFMAFEVGHHDSLPELKAALEEWRRRLNEDADNGDLDCQQPGRTRLC